MIAQYCLGFKGERILAQDINYVCIMINFCFKSSAIALMGLILISSSAIAEPDPEDSSDTSNPVESGIQEGLDKDKPAISVESKKPKELQISEIVEVHPRTKNF